MPPIVRIVVQVKLVSALAPDARASDALGVTASLLIGAVLAFATYWAGVMVSLGLARRRRASG